MMGRKPVCESDARDTGIRIRMTQDEAWLLRNLAEITGETRSDIIRMGIFLYIENLAPAMSQEISERTKEYVESEHAKVQTR